MKLSAVSLLVASLALQASARPIRIIVSESFGASAVDNVNVAHVASAPHVNMALPAPPHHAKGRCAKSKALQLSNWLRKTLGMPLIEGGPHGPHPHPHKHHHKEGEVEGEEHHHMHHGHHKQDGAEADLKEIDWAHILPFPFAPNGPPPPAQPLYPMLKPGDAPMAPEQLKKLDRPLWAGHRGFGKGRMNRWRKMPFMRRLHHALMTLGPWEGRILAFVIGCGIGVLLRMVFVLTVVFVRAISSARRQRQEQAETIFVHTEDATEAENLIVPPPQYMVEDEKFAAPAEV